MAHLLENDCKSNSVIKHCSYRSACKHLETDILYSFIKMTLFFKPLPLNLTVTLVFSYGKFFVTGKWAENNYGVFLENGSKYLQIGHKNRLFKY